MGKRFNPSLAVFIFAVPNMSGIVCFFKAQQAA